MKKLVFAAVAAIALTASVSFVSCDKKAAPAVDTTAVDTTAAAPVVEDTTADTVSADTTAADSAVVK
ncbi:MAG: hypothetical protein J6M19_01995 [Bacteroidaceae bacterium]|nr:hypothetical protein [Bacteroidaceae bacterium]